MECRGSRVESAVYQSQTKVYQATKINAQKRLLQPETNHASTTILRSKASRGDEPRRPSFSEGLQDCHRETRATVTLVDTRRVRRGRSFSFPGKTPIEVPRFQNEPALRLRPRRALRDGIHPGQAQISRSFRPGSGSYGGDKTLHQQAPRDLRGHDAQRIALRGMVFSGEGRSSSPHPGSRLHRLVSPPPDHLSAITLEGYRALHHCHRLFTKFDEMNGLSEHRYEFRPGHSTEQAVKKVQDTAGNHLDIRTTSTLADFRVREFVANGFSCDDSIVGWQLRRNSIGEGESGRRTKSIILDFSQWICVVLYFASICTEYPKS